VEQAPQWEVEAELEDLWSSTARVRDLVLNDVGRSSLMVASMSTVMEWLEGWIDGAAADGVRWQPALCWLPPCRTSQSWTPTFRYLGLDATQD
jgi:hypothetical protein